MQAVESYLRERVQRSQNKWSRLGARSFLLGLEFAGPARHIHEALLSSIELSRWNIERSESVAFAPPLCLKKEDVDLFIDALNAAPGQNRLR